MLSLKLHLAAVHDRIDVAMNSCRVVFTNYVFRYTFFYRTYNIWNKSTRFVDILLRAVGHFSSKSKFAP